MRLRPSWTLAAAWGGYLLAAQRLGFEILGFEPSRDHAHVARDVLKLPVIADYFTAAALQGRKFDLIMLSHVIEHIYEPKPFLAELIGALKPGGKLIVITPNANSYIARASGGRWPMLKPVDHVTLLSKGAARIVTPNDVSMEISTSEYTFEFAATILSVLKGAIKRSAGPLKPTNENGGGCVSAPSILQQLDLSTQVLKLGLSAVSLPFYLAAAATDNAACLKLIISAPK